MQTSRLLLRRMDANDLGDLTNMHGDPRVMATLGGLRSPTETHQWLQSQLDHWQHHDFGLWMVHERHTGRFAGRGGLRHVEIDGRDEVEVAYALLEEFWGRGLATELACFCVSVAWEMLHLPTLVCFTLTTNRASRRVMEKASFRYERDLIHANLPHVLYRLNAEQTEPRA